MNGRSAVHRARPARSRASSSPARTSRRSISESPRRSGREIAGQTAIPGHGVEPSRCSTAVTSSGRRSRHRRYRSTNRSRAGCLGSSQPRSASGKARSRILEVRESRVCKRSDSTPTSPTTSQRTSPTASAGCEQRTGPAHIGGPTRTPSAPSDSTTDAVALTRRTPPRSPPYEHRSTAGRRAR